jgi:hypothetical protein
LRAVSQLRAFLYFVSVDAEGRRPIQFAIIFRAFADISFLLDQGVGSAHLLEDRLRLSLLDCALKYQRLAIVDVLLTMNADWVRGSPPALLSLALVPWTRARKTPPQVSHFARGLDQGPGGARA